MPHDPRTCERTILDWREYDTHIQHRRLYADLLSLRRSETAFDKWIAQDLAYIDQRSFGLDIKILLKTIPVVLRGTGAY